jgi:hypothetical protein
MEKLRGIFTTIMCEIKEKLEKGQTTFNEIKVEIKRNIDKSIEICQRKMKQLKIQEPILKISHT